MLQTSKESKSVIQMTGLTSLGDEEIMEFEGKESDEGLEATLVPGPSGSESKRKKKRKKGKKKLRCFNCGEYTKKGHISAKCPLAPQPKSCYRCKSWDHLIGDCPQSEQVNIVKPDPTKLVVSNLDFGVSDCDIKELFSDFGAMQSVAINYDGTGKSLGTAHVIFKYHSDAVKAVSEYDGVNLDGRPLKIVLDGAGAVAGRPTRPDIRQGGRGGGAGRNPVNRLNQGHGATRGAGERGGSGNRGGGRGGARSGRRGGKAPTVEELDAELDAYVNQGHQVR